MDSMKSQKDITLEEEPPRSEDVQDATREGQRAIANSFRKNEEAGKAEVHQLCMWLVMEVKSDTVKSNIAQEPGMLGPWIKVIGCGQAGDGKSEHQDLRNQWTKVDWNEWI